MTKPVAWWREPTKDQWVTFSAAWAGWVLDAFDFTVFLLVMPQIAKEFGVSITATAGSIALTLLLRLLGGMVAGSMADKWGRRLPLIISVVWFAACDGAIAFADSFQWVLIFRTLFGFGMGAQWTSGATLAMENWPERSRGIASGILQGSWALGYLAAAVISAWIVPNYGWRAMFIVAAVPALLALPIWFWVPESKEWKKERAAKAAAPPEARKTIFTRSLAGRLVWASVAEATGFAVYYGITGLYPTLLQTELGLGTTSVAGHVSLFNVGMLVGSVICGFIAVRRGPAFAIALPAFLLIFALPLYFGFSPGLLLVGAFLGGLLGGGFTGVTPLLLTSIFPTEVRARSVGLVYHVGASVGAFTPMGIAALAEHTTLDLKWAMGSVTGVAVIGLVLTLVLRPKSIAPPPPRPSKNSVAQPQLAVEP